MKILPAIKRYAPTAITADEFTARGGDFDKAQSQFIIDDGDSWLAFAMTMLVFGHGAIAYHLIPTGLGGHSVEILWHDGTPPGRFYDSLPQKITRKVVERRAAKHPPLNELLAS